MVVVVRGDNGDGVGDDGDSGGPGDMPWMPKIPNKNNLFYWANMDCMAQLVTLL